MGIVGTILVMLTAVLAIVGVVMSVLTLLDH
jgi:hypothetical protein